MDKKKSLLNICVSVGFKIVTMIMALFVRRILIQTCGNETNGLNALYLSIIGFLAVAELGVGSAITFCMYKPIVLDQKEKVAALYRFFRKSYLLIGIVIFVAGIMITPYIRYFAKDYAQLDVDFSGTFFLMLVSVVITYLFGAETALINAYKNNYITTAIYSCGILLQYGLQMIVLLLTQSFEGYLMCRILAALIQWIVTEIVARKYYSDVLAIREHIDSETKRDVSRNIKAMFMHKIGGLLVNTVDSIVISIFVGVAVLGTYSNYLTILDSATGILALAFSSLTSIFGHLYVQADKKTTQNVAEAFHMLNFCIGVIFYMGYYAVADSIIAILFGECYVIDGAVLRVIAINGFVRFQRRCMLTFREATGMFYYDRWKPLFEGSANLVLSVLLVKYIGVAGVILATILTNLLVCHIVEPYVLYKHAFNVSPVSYYIRNYGMMAVFGISILFMDYFFVEKLSPWRMLFANGCTSVAVSLVTCGLVLVCNGKIARYMCKLFKEK